MLACGALVHSIAAAPAAGAAAAHDANDVSLTISPRICTLANNDTECSTVVHASWQATHDESLCLVIVERPEIKRCWENYSAGSYSIELAVSADLEFQLRDVGLHDVLAAQVLKVIHEALSYRHKRRAPWNLFD